MNWQRDLSDQLWLGWRSAKRLIILPVIILTTLLILAGGIAMGWSAIQKPPTPPNVMDQEVTETSTDMYAQYFLDSATCVLGDSPSCDEGNRRSDLIVLATEEVMHVNGKDYPVPTAKDVPKALQESGLADLSLGTMTTEQEGSYESVITYQNDKGEKIVFTFENNDEGELVVKSIEWEKP